MRIRRAATLVCTFEGDKPVVHNFLKKEMFACTAQALEILAVLDNWTGMEDALACLPAPLETSTALLKKLITLELVVLEDSPAAERDQRYRDNWRWGAVAGFYHFGLRDSEFIDTESKREQLLKYKAAGASPPLLTSNEGLVTVDLPEIDLDDSFLRSLYERRSKRDFNASPISVQALADCLFAGNGLKEVLDAEEYGRLPLTMTPSGGARNPFELYVWARNVEGIEPGYYHYSAAEHSLGFLHNEGVHQPAALLGKQEWTNNAAAVIFFAATFERSAWKYRQALAYRVILMEVGAITQNIQLAATHRGVAAAPTGALAESRIEELLALREIEQGAMFAVVLGTPA